jgi:biotin carboxyl carrier protein
MKLNLKLYAGSKTRDRALELLSKPEGAATEGHLEFALDGEPREAAWAEISPGVYSILIAGQSYEVQLKRPAGGAPPGAYNLRVGARQYQVEVQDPRQGRPTVASAPEGPQEILAPMPGRIVKVLVEEDQPVESGQGLLVIEAMKMQNELRAPRAGVVEKIYVREGIGVESGSKLLRLV